MPKKIEKETVTVAAAKPVAPPTFEQCRAAVQILDAETGKPIDGDPADDQSYVIRRSCKAVIPAQSIMREFRAKFPKAVFEFRN